jgi:hypothetical protein
MSIQKVVVAGPSFSLGTALFILFLTLKLIGTIDWSWWWVTAPLWIPLAMAGTIFIVLVGVMFVAHMLKK